MLGVIYVSSLGLLLTLSSLEDTCCAFVFHTVFVWAVGRTFVDFWVGGAAVWKLPFASDPLPVNAEHGYLFVATLWKYYRKKLFLLNFTLKGTFIAVI